LNYDLVNLIQLMFLVIGFAGIISYTVYSYKNFKNRAKEKITRNILTVWLSFIKKLRPEDCIVYEKYGIWIYLVRFKIEMMF